MENIRQKDKQFLRTPDKWPRYPLLALRHNSRPLMLNGKLNDGSLGFILNQDGGPPYKVYVGNLYFGVNADTPIERYATEDALFAEWHVD